MRIFIIAVCTLLLTTAVHAGFSAADMQENCYQYFEAKAGRGSTDVVTAAKVGQCRGAFDALAGFAILGRDTWQFCVPGQATLDQTIRIFLHHVENHPEELHEHWILPAMISLREAFPGRCREG